MPNFSLVQERWIPVRTIDGKLEFVGLRDLLHRAPDLSAIEHPIPIVECGLVRLAVALVHDILRPDTLDHVIELLRAGRFDESIVESYLADHDRHFDLFSSAHPFLQDPASSGKPKPLAAIAPLWPSGTNVSHWQHGLEADFAVTPAEAAQLLATVPAFMTAGGAGLAPSINGAPPTYVIPAGETLFQTLAVNLWVRLPGGVELGKPAWREPARSASSGRRTSATMLEAMTWRPRRIRLVPGEGGRSTWSGEESPVLVRTMYFAAGDKVDFPWTDPHVAYVHSAKGRVPVRLREDRDPWRDVAPLALLREQLDPGKGDRIAYERPGIVTQLVELQREAPTLTPRELRLQLYGIRTDLKMKVFEHVAQQLALPVPLMLDSELPRHLAAAVQRAEDVQRALRDALTAAVTPVPGMSTGMKAHDRRSAAQTLHHSATRRYWANLEQSFHQLVHALGEGPAPESRIAILAGWEQALADEARLAFVQATARFRGDGRQLMAVVQGSARLEGALRSFGDSGAEPGRGSRRGAGRPRRPKDPARATHSSTFSNGS